MSPRPTISKKKTLKGSPGKLRIGVWNRLEPRPRSDDFSRALSAPVADALFMLSKQWLLGEFKGEDTGTAITAKIAMSASPVSRFGISNGAPVGYDESIPLETRIEAEAVPFDMKMYIQISNAWRKRLKANGVPKPVYTAFLDAYAFRFAESAGGNTPHEEVNTGLQRSMSNLEEEEDIQADKSLSLTLKTLSGKVLEAASFLAYLLNIGEENTILEDAIMDSATRAAVDNNRVNIITAASELLDWFDGLFFQPEANNLAWEPSRLEYQFKLATKNATSGSHPPRTPIVAREYYRGNPDWYAYEIDDPASHSDLLNNTPLPGEQNTIKKKELTLLTTGVSFPGMPKNRYWEFEDGRINFGKQDVHTTDLAALVLAEFAFIYGNDWFLVPFRAPVGSFCEVENIVVTDCFGFKTKVNAASENPLAQNWSMFNLSNTLDNTSTPDTRVFIPPVTYKTQEGPPIEKVVFIKDEMANMVWGIERTIPGIFGEGIDAYQAYLKLKRYLQASNPLVDEEEVEATFQYQLMTAVPENWIPFLPVNVVSDSSTVKLKFQRGRLRRDIQGVDDKNPVEPRGVLLTEEPAPYFIEEEEIPREGIQVFRSFQRARWWNGKTVCWLGRKKQTGKGEGKSNLKFDSII